MRVILVALLAAAGLGLAAGAILDSQQRPAYERFATAGARVGQPGSNLVGPQWTGMGTDQKADHRS